MNHTPPRQTNPPTHFLAYAQTLVSRTSQRFAAVLAGALTVVLVSGSVIMLMVIGYRIGGISTMWDTFLGAVFLFVQEARNRHQLNQRRTHK